MRAASILSFITEEIERVISKVEVFIFIAATIDNVNRRSFVYCQNIFSLDRSLAFGFARQKSEKELIK